MTNLKLKRIHDNGKETIGEYRVIDDLTGELFRCHCLELPWKDNFHNVSCIPKGEYNVEKIKSEKYGECFWIKDVPNRSEVLIHSGNYYTDIRGCQLPGLEIGDLNDDGISDVLYSKRALIKLLKFLPDKFKLTIT